MDMSVECVYWPVQTCPFMILWRPENYSCPFSSVTTYLKRYRRQESPVTLNKQ